ncbi:Coproporphyrinogen III oxidase, oxygen-independent [hydrothermal vent metagenome]|uniref:Oxygen-independent coproporphyrinogen III oxidase n=1 Tax=hydrothermal vent metagenome TaxID=652676 RepID=A0A3B1B220_9ZZZZ
MPNLEFDYQLIEKYDLAGPRYTSYPTAVQFSDEFSISDYQQQAADSNQSGRALSLYFHLPFCDTICYYCACNKIVTKNRKRAQPYLDRLYNEIKMQAQLFDDSRKVNQLHWGGGTPTFISHDQMRELMKMTRAHFNLYDDDSGEYSIEIDPREADTKTINLLRELGFNRISLGVQDVNPLVQKAVNRIQSIEQTTEVINAARTSGFHSASIDLIYGLPHQTGASFAHTLETVLELDPDRLSIFNYAHLPDMFKTQKQIDSNQLPSARVKLAILENSINTLTAAGYVYIGMDHFAKPDDELAIAQRKHNLYRNFQGYSTHADCDLIGMGVTSIGMINNSYSQNFRTMDDYTNCIDSNKLAVFRGIALNNDDKLRRHVITELICNFKLDIKSIEEKYSIVFADYFSSALMALASMQEDGLINISDSVIEVSAKGSLFIRNICMTFDVYLKHHSARFSKVL